MPELPEVNTFQRYFDQTALQQKIVRTRVSDDKIIRNLSGESFVEQLTGRTFIKSYRRGKYLFGEMDNGHHLLLHFGMTGDLVYYQEPEDAPPYERFAFDFSNGFSLGFDCPRKFARICYITDLDEYIKELGLGEDALVIQAAAFLAEAKGKKSTLKGFLLNQKYLAGVGNLYADEVCYQTRIHPASRVDKLPEKQLRAIHAKLQEILQYAVDQNAYYKQYPDDWLWKWRTEDAQAPDGSPVQTAKIGGRTTYFFDGYQKLFV
jgi:formamidopyrimidine-DNA glycosylase